jgi:hypothetical protein
MSGTDDRSPGSIGELALSWGMSPEDARRIEAVAAAIVVDADVTDQRSRWLAEPCEQRRRRGTSEDRNYGHAAASTPVEPRPDGAHERGECEDPSSSR